MKSSFQFSNPVLVGLEFYANEAFAKLDNKQEVQISMNMSVQISREKYSREAIVGLTVEIGEREEMSPFFIKATEKANFRWDETLDDSMINVLLNQNAPALLLSYLRPIVVQITASSPYNVYNIPFINFQKN